MGGKFMTELEALKFVVEQFSHVPKYKNDGTSSKLGVALRTLKKTIKNCENGNATKVALEALRVCGTPAVLSSELKPLLLELVALSAYDTVGHKSIHAMRRKLGKLLVNALKPQGSGQAKDA